jgi:hypothetical protein
MIRGLWYGWFGKKWKCKKMTIQEDFGPTAASEIWFVGAQKKSFQNKNSFFRRFQLGLKIKSRVVFCAKWPNAWKVRKK